MTCCPNCGYQRADIDYAPELMALRMAPQARDIILRLCQAQGGWVSSPTLVDLLWGDDSEGGPYDPSMGIRVFVYRLRRIIASQGWGIEWRAGLGYRLIRSLKRPTSTGYVCTMPRVSILEKAG
jgi:DNA-binding response OmpR family regulator